MSHLGQEAAATSPEIVERKLCIVTYTFGANGPWNYFFEQPPEGVKFVHMVGVYVGETERHHLVTSDFCSLADGKVMSIHPKHFDKGSVTIEFL
jgi:hypothetical protein